MDYKQLEHFFFGSKTRVKILVLLIMGGKDELYLRELSRRIKSSAGNTRRELNNLERAGLLKSRREGNLKYFSLDPTNPLYRPIREMIIKIAGIPELLKVPLVAHSNISAAFIYGSFVKGGFDNQSDIDLFILTDTNCSVFEKINVAVEKFEQKFGREINVDLMAKQEFCEKLNNNDSYLSDILKGKKLFLKGGMDDLRPETCRSTKS
jgi:predicted nucleotidyltransferase